MIPMVTAGSSGALAGIACPNAALAAESVTAVRNHL
jgi:hypothetical protein